MHRLFSFATCCPDSYKVQVTFIRGVSMQAKDTLPSNKILKWTLLQLLNRVHWATEAALHKQSRKDTKSSQTKVLRSQDNGQ